MPRTKKNAYHRKDGRWEVRITVYDGDGNEVQKSVYGKTYREAMEKAKEVQKAKNNVVNEKIKNENVNVVNTTIENANSNGPNMDWVIKKWMEIKKKELKSISFQKYKGYIDDYISPYFGVISLTLVNYNILSSFTVSLSEMNLSEKSIYAIMRLTIEIINFFNYQNIHFSVSDFCNNKKKEDFSIMSKQDMRCLTDYLTEETDYMKLGILIAMYTGVTIGELCSLKWSDFVNGKMQITKTVARIKAEGDSKTENVVSENAKRRSIPLPSFIAEIIQNVKKVNSAYVVNNKTTIPETRTVQRKFKKYLETCDLDDFKISDLRDTYAVRCLELGVDPRHLADLLGTSYKNLVKFFEYVNTEFDEEDYLNKISKLS